MSDVKIQCDYCKKYIEKNTTDVKIQRNLLTGKMQCIDCAWNEWTKENIVNKEQK